MTFEQFLRDRLTNCAMFPEQVDAVIKRVKEAPENKPMAERWNDDVSGYPSQMQSLAWFTAKRHALEYIDAECPEAWFRPMFADESSESQSTEQKG